VTQANLVCFGDEYVVIDEQIARFFLVILSKWILSFIRNLLREHRTVVSLFNNFGLQSPLLCLRL